MLAAYFIREENRMEVSPARWDIYLSSCNFLVQLVKYDNFDSYPMFCWSTNTIRPSLHHAQATSHLMNQEPWDKIEYLQWGMFMMPWVALHYTPLVTLRPHASQSKLRWSKVVPIVQSSNKATHKPSNQTTTHNWGHRIGNTSFFGLQCN